MPRLLAEPVSGRLSREFSALSPDVVTSCVTEVHHCVAHLGLDPTPALVERIAREHLTGMVKSEPPSGRVHAETHGTSTC
ncbi:hypothetical protein [Actinocorallia longicatena]|uniref:Uncharacterized protein n=1 Tax=Actinocorallia longicatena TaxID=111803 RepID=A0ABP6QIE2_9ACTN